jgi:hypothetical protein
MRGQKVLYYRHGYRSAGRIVATLVDFPGHYAVFLIRDLCTYCEYPINSKDVVYI